MVSEKYQISKDMLPNTSLPLIMHIDMNGFFASCEQQENPFLRGKPVGVVPGMSNGSTVIASSYEAKAYGVKTGTKVREAKELCPNIIFKLADPAKYLYINKKLMEVFYKHTPHVTGKSIDEAVLSFKNSYFLSRHSDPDLLRKESSARNNPNYQFPISNLHNSTTKGSLSTIREDYKKLNVYNFMTETAFKIKKDINKRVGDHLGFSVGVGPNRFLAKMASKIYKPNGFFIVDYTNLDAFYDVLELEDLHGIASRMAKRLNNAGIYKAKEFKSASLQELKSRFGIFGYYWKLRLNGYEIDDIQGSGFGLQSNGEGERKSVGHSYHLPIHTVNREYLEGILLKLSEKTSSRLRRYGLKTRCFSFYCLYKDNTSWGKSKRISFYTDNSAYIYKEFINLFNLRDKKYIPIKIIGVSTSMFANKNYDMQYDLFGETIKNENFYKAVDTVNNIFGKYTLMPARLLKFKEDVPDRIAFGNKIDPIG